MAKITILLMAVVFAFGFMVTNAFADEQMGTGMGKPFALSSMVGTSVLDPKGEYLGRASDFVIDSQGNVIGNVTGNLSLHSKDPELIGVWEAAERRISHLSDDAEIWLQKYLEDKGYRVE